MKKYCLFLLVPLILFLAQTSIAAECGFGTPVFERTFERTKSEPFTEHATFSSVNGKATIKLYNGGVEQNKRQRVTDATIRVNGSIVFEEMMFNKQVGYLTDQVDLFDENDIEVYLQGNPGSKVTIRIFHEDLDAIRQFWHVVEELYETSFPAAAVLTAWFNNNVTEDFIHETANRTDELNSWISKDGGPRVGITLCPVIGTPMEDVPGSPYPIPLPYEKGYQVSIEYAMPGGMSGSFLTYMVYNGTKWLWYGDHVWVRPEFGSFMGMTFNPYYIEYPIYTTGLAITLWDDNYLAYELSVRSGIVTGPGLPPEGIKLSHMYPEPFLRLYNYNPPNYNPHNPWHYLLDDESIMTIPDTAEYTFRLYAEDPAVVTLEDTPLYSFTETIHKRPVLNADLDASMFPTLITPSTHYTDDWGIGGIVNVIWTNPDNMKVDYMNLGVWYNNAPWYAFLQRNVTPGVTTVSIDTTGGVWANQLYMTGFDEYERRFGLAWLFFMTWP